MSIVDVRAAQLGFGERTIWSGLDLQVHPGEFVAVLGTSGTGKTSLLKVLLGVVPLSAGKAWVLDKPVRRGRTEVSYVPQQRSFPRDAPLRGSDLVRFGVDGHRWGIGGGRRTRDQVDTLLEAVGAEAFAHQRVGRLSGGEQQRLRIAQALASRPRLMLCDEPLQNLDLGHQRAIVDLIDLYRWEHTGTVLFVTHDINPVLHAVDRVLYIVGGVARSGTVEEVMNSEVLSEMYGEDIEVIRRHDRLIVVGSEQHAHHPGLAHVSHEVTA